jgi:glycosyltransferase involved in cell wall biosynthesis
MVGWSSPVKDPLFALDVLDALRADDPAWRLVLLGAGFPPSQRARSARYQERFEQRLRERPALAAAIDRPGHVDEIGRPEVGFVLSASLREGFPVGIMEATASAAVPVVRDWPVVRPYGGARSIFPEAWVVEDAPAAAARIRALDDPPRRAEEAEVARRHVVDHYDWSRCAHLYDALLLS